MKRSDRRDGPRCWRKASSKSKQKALKGTLKWSSENATPIQAGRTGRGSGREREEEMRGGVMWEERKEKGPNWGVGFRCRFVLTGCGPSSRSNSVGSSFGSAKPHEVDGCNGGGWKRL